MNSEHANPLHETLSEIAIRFERTVEALALDIHAVATHLELSGNRGAGKATLQHEKLPDYFLVAEAMQAWARILFFNDDKHFQGWQCRKNPHWLDVWSERYGDLPACKQIAEDWASIKARQEQEAIEKAKPKRQSETFEEGRWADFSTDQIGQRAAVADLMTVQLRERFHEARSPLYNQDNMIRFAYNVWRGIAERCWAELQYRAQVGDVDAERALLDGIGRYFTNAQLIEESIDPLLLEPLHPIPFVPKVVHVRSREWINCAEDERVYIGRNSHGFKDNGWGNPHKVAKLGREEAIELYRQELLHDAKRLARLEELRGKRVLGCWCKSADRQYSHWVDVDQPCHGDVLVALLALPLDEYEKLLLAAQGEDMEE